MPVYKSISKAVASCFYIGYIPLAPGTFGSFAGLVFIWVTKPDYLQQVFIIIAFFILGVISSQLAEKEFGESDSPRIVIDEFVGYLISMAFLPLTLGYMISAFFLFRFFDILKPSPIKIVERHFHGGWGVMLDDVAAGVFTNLILQCWRLL